MEDKFYVFLREFAELSNMVSELIDINLMYEIIEGLEIEKILINNGHVIEVDGNSKHAAIKLLNNLFAPMYALSVSKKDTEFTLKDIDAVRDRYKKKILEYISNNDIGKIPLEQYLMSIEL